MTNLKCNVINCAYNQDHLCCLEGIDIRGNDASSRFDTCCASFASKDGRYSASLNESPMPRNELEIHCTATQCVHHRKDHSCDADCVRVGSFSHDTSRMEETQCVTFAKNKLHHRSV